MTRKHVLTTGNDRFGGTNGKDLYVGTMLISGSDTFSTLGSDDTLDGGKGTDTVRADLVTGLVVPVMKNIEIGIFTLAKDFPVTLDLARAGQMTTLDLGTGSGIGTGSSTPTLYVQHAAGITDISLKGVANQILSVEGIDTKQVKTEHVTFRDVEFGKLDLQTKTGASFAVLDITLEHADFGGLIGDVASPKIRIHSVGKGDFTNGLVFSPDQNGEKIRTLTVDGTSDVKFVNAFDNLKRFDASHFSGSIRELQIGGQFLTSVLGGSDKDVLAFASIGGTAKHMAKISTGAGNDYINMTGLGDLSARHVLIDGGSDTGDTVAVEGQTHSIAGLLKRVEAITIFNLNGSYDLDDRHLVAMQVTAPYGNTTLNNLRDGFYLNCNDTLNWNGFTLTANVKNATTSDHETLTLNIYGSIVFGGPSGGFSTPHLSNLTIDSVYGENIAYLAQVGTTGDPTHLTIDGTSHLDLRAANASNSGR